MDREEERIPKNEVNIRVLQQELNRLRLAADNIERIINTAQRQEEQDIPEAERNRRPTNYRHNHPVVRDRDGIEILIGDQVEFLTRGNYSSTRGVVYKIAGNGSRVTARDQSRQPISRAPRNIRVIF